MASLQHAFGLTVTLGPEPAVSTDICLLVLLWRELRLSLPIARIFINSKSSGVLLIHGLASDTKNSAQLLLAHGGILVLELCMTFSMAPSNCGVQRASVARVCDALGRDVRRDAALIEFREGV